MALSTDSSLIPGATVVSDSAGGVAVFADYALTAIVTHLSAISESLASIDTNIAAIAETIGPEVTTAPRDPADPAFKTTFPSESGKMAADLNIIARLLSAIESHDKKLRELGEGHGIHWRRPNEWDGGAASWHTTSQGPTGTIETTTSTNNISS